MLVDSRLPSSLTPLAEGSVLVDNAEVLVAYAPQAAAGGRRRPRRGRLLSSPMPLAEGPVLVDNAEVYVARAPQAAAWR